MSIVTTHVYNAVSGYLNQNDVDNCDLTKGIIL